ncbi:MAG: hypothetical protein AAFN50_06370 [Pseudomonadota bacterium]
MIRIIGILIGSALSVALLIVVLGVPEFGSAEPEPVEWQETAIEAAIATEPPADVEVAAEPEPAPEPEAVVETVVEPVAEPVTEVAPDTGDALVDAIFSPVEERPVEIIQENWYAFWSPFRSEIAANGFVEQLQRTTGLDYRVVKQKPGVYEVAFAYEDDTDIRAKLDSIAAATGLEMPDG